MESSVMIYASLEEIESMINRAIDTKLANVLDEGVVHLKKLQKQLDIKDLRVLKNACNRNGVTIYGIGSGAYIKKSEINKILKRVN